MRPAATAALALLAACAAGPRRLPSTAALREALEAGRPVRVVVRYAGCVLRGEGGTERPGPDVVGGMTVSAFERFAPGVAGNERAYLATSASQLIGHRRYGQVVNYVRLRVEDGGAVEVTARYLRPPGLEVVMDETFVCPLDDGGRGGVTFYSGR